MILSEFFLDFLCRTFPSNPRIDSSLSDGTVALQFSDGV